MRQQPPGVGVSDREPPQLGIVQEVGKEGLGAEVRGDGDVGCALPLRRLGRRGIKRPDSHKHCDQGRAAETLAACRYNCSDIHRLLPQ